MNLNKRKKMFVMGRNPKQTLSKQEVKVEPQLQKVVEPLPVALKDLEPQPVVVEEAVAVQQDEEIKSEPTKTKKNTKVVEKEEEV